MKTTTTKIRLLLADDHPVVREGLRHCLSSHEQFEIVGEAADGEETLRRAAELLPDVVLMDINMPGLNGLQATKRLRSETPGVRVLALTMHDNREYVLGIIHAGAAGYVLKDASPGELVQAIQHVHAGQTFFSPQIVHHVLNDYVARAGQVEGNSIQSLSGRENQVLAMVAEGCGNKEIASKLGIGIRTVESHRENIMNKLAIHSVAGLTKYALAKGIVHLPEQ